jgi:hypothetical protein
MVADGTTAQIPSDLGEKKEDNEGNLFYTSLAVGTHHGGRNLARKGGAGALFLEIRGGSAGHRVQWMYGVELSREDAGGGGRRSRR